MSDANPLRFRCDTCGEEHDVADLSFGADAPALWRVISDAERSDSTLSSDRCVIVANDGTSYYVRGCLDVPIRGVDAAFTWGVWCSLSERSFGEVTEHWDDPSRIKFGPYFGWLCTPLPTYPDTMFLKTHVLTRGFNLRPLVELETTDHPLAIHQRDGIEPAELQQMIATLLHRK